MNQGKILPEASHSIHETNFGFFDSYPDKNVLNSQLFFYLKLLKLMAKKDANILILKDFLAKRAPSIAKCKNSLVVHARLEEMEFKHKDVSQTKESVFNLKELMDEKELSAQAVDLNIKLMRWRQLDTLDLELLHSVKVLLLGAGTLGCQLARNLIGWGVKHITFVDYGKVSHSNPVRQSLYNFEDVINGGKPKAETAAEALLKIQPTMTTAGYSFMIPMPGHSVRQDEQEKMFENLDLLDKLVSEHDAVMLLLDTREARWLPTVIASAHNKICFSVALGFDNFIIIRHGASPINYDETISGKRPGCYFCNDYLSPSNTMKDRSLDQQCTVTRPGLSFISSAYASELLVNMLHLKKEHIEKELKGEPLSNEFGLVPQHVRGTASGFNVDLMTSEAYDNCLACGAKIVNEYKRDKRALILKAVNDPNYLQEVSGIKEDLQIGGEGMGEIVCIDDLL
jgi:ubiquitin-like modifier-activating enzyme ATG7